MQTNVCYSTLASGVMTCGGHLLRNGVETSLGAMMGAGGESWITQEPSWMQLM